MAAAGTVRLHKLLKDLRTYAPQLLRINIHKLSALRISTLHLR
jgi:hypothetical protein